MIRRWFSVTGVVLVVLLVVVSGVDAKTEWQVLQNLSLEESPIDLVVSEDKRQVYVLTDGGRLLIYDLNGQLNDRIDVGGEVKQIRPGPREDILYLISPGAKSVRMISITSIQEIDIKGAPFKGPENAPVTVVLFSDFQ